MIINPILPVWLMGILCVIFLFFKRKGTWNFIRQIAIVLLLFMINLRIMVGDDNAETVAVGADVLFVVDNTISMLAEDYNGNERRIDAVRKDCAYIMEQLPGASYGVVSFGNNVQFLMPYTVDSLVIEQTIQTLNGESSIHAFGTTFNNVLEELPKILDNKRDNYQVVFFISDGENTGNEDLKSVSGIQKYINSGAVLGYGTKEGGPMQAFSIIGIDEPPEYLTVYDDDFNEINAISKLDEANLERIAGDLGVPYVHMKDTRDIDGILADIKQGISSAPKSKAVESTEGYSDIYFIFVITLLLLLVIDFVYYRRKV